MPSRRFIITINEDEGNFDITTPDGHIDYNTLVETLDMILGTLLNHFVPEELAEEKQEEVTPVADPKKLN